MVKSMKSSISYDMRQMFNKLQNNLDGGTYGNIMNEQCRTLGITFPIKSFDEFNEFDARLVDQEKHDALVCMWYPAGNFPFMG